MRLPDVPSRLVTLALGDLRRTEADERYAVNMDFFHVPAGGDRPCVVCLAGAVMAKSLHAEPDQARIPEHFEHDTCDKLVALDAFRRGHIIKALHMMHVRTPGHPLVPLSMHVTGYHESPEQFKADMREVVRVLEGAGL